MVFWWNDRDVEVVEINGRMVALYGWNGEKWYDCWEVEEIIGDTAFGIKKDGLVVSPITEITEDGDYDYIGYEIE